MNVAKIKPNRCSQTLVLHKEGILIPFTGIHLGGKKSRGQHIKAALHHFHFLLQSGSTLSKLHCNALSAVFFPSTPTKIAGQNRPYANTFVLSKLNIVSKNVFKPLEQLCITFYHHPFWRSFLNFISNYSLTKKLKETVEHKKQSLV